jgi:hypothetical protein
VNELRGASSSSGAEVFLVNLEMQIQMKKSLDFCVVENDTPLDLY